MEKKLCHNCLGDMYPDGNGWKCCACGVCMDADGRHYMPAPPPLTNADRIRGMSDEEMAEYCGRVVGCPTDGGCHRHSGSCVACWLDWLRQPVTQPHPGADDNHDHSGLLEE